MLDCHEPALSCISYCDKRTELLLIDLESELQTNHGFPLKFCGRVEMDIGRATLSTRLGSSRFLVPSISCTSLPRTGEGNPLGVGIL